MIPNIFDNISIRLNDLPKGEINCNNSTKAEKRTIKIKISK